MIRSVRRVCYVSGTRADFGLMASTLQRLHADPGFEVGVVITGMHLDESFGATWREVEAAGLPIAARIPVRLSENTGAAMARNIGVMVTGMAEALEACRPDMVLLLGDRGEMLAGAIAAIHLGIAIVHVHGGERSGTVDEPIRHAISKLATLHLVATEASRDRLIRMGEHGRNIVVVGAPGLDGLTDLVTKSREQLCWQAGFDPLRPVALLLFHPVLSEADVAGQQMRAVAEAARQAGCQVLALMPNSDAGADAVRAELARHVEPGRFVLHTHLARHEFVSWMAHADLMLGNSSSGIIEAATFGTPVVNVGARQNLRERNANVRDVPVDAIAIEQSIREALASKFSPSNVYGDGRSAERIVSQLAAWDLSLVEASGKANAY